MWPLESADRSRVRVVVASKTLKKRKGTKRRSMYFWERTGMIEADSSEALRKACQYELKTESTKERSPTELRCASFPARLSVTWGAVKGQDERPLSGAPLTAPHVTTGGLCRWKAINKVGRHVGLDFYDLLIEGVSTQNPSANLLQANSLALESWNRGSGGREFLAFWRIRLGWSERGLVVRAVRAPAH
jgi:hypothetical protein